jgi:hypothetical protein
VNGVPEEIDARDLVIPEKVTDAAMPFAIIAGPARRH